MNEVQECNASFEKKLMACPFVTLGSTAISAVTIVEEWDAEDHPLLPSTATLDEESVFVNWTCPLTQYQRRDESAYSFAQDERLLCSTMCLPRRISKSTRYVEALQRCREIHVARQMKNARIILTENDRHTCYQIGRAHV